MRFVTEIVILFTLAALCLEARSLRRDDAFIGYSELSSKPNACTDQLPDCDIKWQDNFCLYDAFEMRRFCPSACNLERCSQSTQGSDRRIPHKGFASREGTLMFKQGMDALHGLGDGHWHNTSLWPSLPLLHLSSLGIGTYLGDPDPDTDEKMEASVIYSVYRGGWNVIDTASNYRYGRSEVAVGLALDSLIAGDSVSDFYHDASSSPPAATTRALITQTAQHQISTNALMGRSLRFDLTRDMLFISTKGGFMDQPLLDKLLASEKISKKDVIHGHCIHPLCLEASLALSLERLNLESVDLFYLHNAAEMQLQELGREAFMQRLLLAFQFLEKAKAEGKIRHYGLATWSCFRVPPTDPTYLPLAEVVKIAEAAAEGTRGHGLQYIQLPINPVMNEAYTQKGWQKACAEDGSIQCRGEEMTLLKAGSELGVAFFSSAPMMEAELLQGKGVEGIGTGSLDSILELEAKGKDQDLLSSTSAKLLQLARSTPGVMAALVGHKTREHVESNVKVSFTSALTDEEFRVVQAKITKRRRMGAKRS